MLAQLLLEIAPHASGLDGEGSWVTTKMIGVLFAGIAAVVTAAGVAYSKGKSSSKVEVENQPLHVKQVDHYVTRGELKPLEQRIERVEASVERSRDEQAKQYRQLLESGAEREVRVLDKIDKMQSNVSKRIDEIFKTR
jgi:hypothetical protein